jgi:hypothetical protein
MSEKLTAWMTGQTFQLAKRAAGGVSGDAERRGGVKRTGRSGEEWSGAERGARGLSVGESDCEGEESDCEGRFADK